MNFLKRALYAITRKKGQTVILFIVFLVIANLVLTGISIKSATVEAGKLAREKLGGSITLSYDTQKAFNEARAANATSTTQGQEQGQQRMQITRLPVTEDMAAKIAKLNHIIDYNYVVSTMAMADGFTAVTTTDTSSSSASSSSTSQTNNNNNNNANRPNFVMPDVSISGVRSTQLLDAFNDGTDKLVEGRQITEADKDKKVVVIEKNLASQNSIKVGGTIKLKSTATDAVSSAYTIVGIYETTATTTQDGGGRMGNMTFNEPYNKIYTDYGSALALKVTTTNAGPLSSTAGIDNAVFYLDDPANMDTVKADAAKLDIDYTKFKIDANDTAYKQMMGPIENVASFSVLVVILVGIAGAIILALILMLSIKERKYETGVLLSMGEKKLKVISQYLVEVIAIAVIAFALSIFTGNLIAGRVGNALVQNEISTEQAQQTSQQDNGFGGMGGRQFRLNDMRNQGSTVAVATVDKIDVKISFNEVWMLYLLGLLIIGLATIIPASSIMRYNPKTILTKAI